MQSNLGKILRLNADGSVPADNPFVEQAAGDGDAEANDVTAQIWSLGHRNPLGLAFDAGGQLWNHDMGPSGGDELNRVERGGNYGYPGDDRKRVGVRKRVPVRVDRGGGRS